MKPSASLLFFLLLSLFFPSEIFATQPLYEGDDSDLYLSGHVQSFSGIYHIPEEVLRGQIPKGALIPLELLPIDTGLSVSLLRLELKGNVGEWFTGEIHSRFFLQNTSNSFLEGVGIGATQAPNRTLDVESDLVESSGLLLQHDLDRLILRFYFEDADLSIGRQAITWGSSGILSPVDLWSQRSPFDLDNSQKRGMDAIRVLGTLTEESEWELVVADRGSLEDLSAGVRVGFFLEAGDAYFALGKFWDELILLGGVSLDLKKLTVRGDIAAPLDLDDGTPQLPRATLGVDWFKQEGGVSLEYHFNGAGVSNQQEYIAHATTDEVFRRGEVYLLGQHYVGVAGQYRPMELLTFGSSIIANIIDPSAMVTGSVSYAFQQDVDLSLGVTQGVGATPTQASTATALVNISEFGSVGGLYYLHLSAFF